MLKHVLLLCTLSVLFATSAACAFEISYTAYNMWREPHTRMWIINYKRGEMIPVGTMVRDIRIHDKYAEQYISFNRVSDGKLFHVYFRRKFHPGKNLADYRKRMFSNYPFEDRIRGMSEKEIDAIRRGVLVTGMSKKAVKMAYGYPPEHHTPNLKGNKWRYWTSRMVYKDICFNSAGRTIRCNKVKNDEL